MMKWKFDDTKRFISQYSPELVIIILAILPVLFTWGRLSIGGDVLIPFNSEGLEKYLYQWINLKNGQYFAINYYPFYFIYQLLEEFTGSVYIISSVLLFLLNMIGGFGIYRLAELFSKSSSRFTLLLPIVFYLLSPALLNAYHYIFVYSFAPWFIYFVFKSIKRKQLSLGDMIWLNLVFAFCSIDLPNPKYLFHLYFIAAVIYILSWFFQVIDFRIFRKIVMQFALSFVLSAYLLLPLANFVLNYDPVEYGVRVKKDYKDSGKMMNYGVDTLDRVYKLHQDSVFLNYLDAFKYTNNAFIHIGSYFFIFIIFLSLLFIHRKDSVDTRKEIIIWVLLLFYLFFAAGPNRPFGHFYEYMVTKFSLLAFLRTTAGAVFFISIFYALLLFFFVEHLRKFKTFTTITLLLSILFVGYPYINGQYYKNFNSINQFTDIEQRGYSIPNEYFQAREIIDYQKINARTFYPNSDLTYLNTEWGFFGPVIYNFLYRNYNVGYDRVFGSLENHNIGFIFSDSSLMNKVELEVKNKVEAWKAGFLELSYIEQDDFLPRLYTATQVGSFDDSEINQPKLDVAKITNPGRIVSFLDKKNIIHYPGLEVSQDVVLEYKMINPTKFRVRAHNVEKKFILVLSEQFHKDWRLYPQAIRQPSLGEAETLLKQAAEKYALLEKNDYFQASQGELRGYIERGWITSVGDGTLKRIEHKKWQDDKGVLDRVENHTIDFISKNFQGTIQNDNLPEGLLWETWFEQPVENNANHLIVNSYANGWVIDAESLCSRTKDLCLKKSDETFDIEIVIEFWPQRVSSVGMIISGLALLTLFFLASFLKIRGSRYLLMEGRTETGKSDKIA